MISSSRKRRRRLATLLAAGVSLEEALDRSEAQRARTVLRSGGTVEVALEADAWIDRQLRCVIAEGLRTGSLPAAARAFGSRKTDGRGVLFAVGLTLCYPMLIALLLLLKAPAPSGFSESADVAFRQMSLGEVHLAALIVLGISCTYWLLFALRPQWLRTIPPLRGVYDRAVQITVAAGCAELLRAGVTPGDALLAASRIAGTTTQVFPSAQPLDLKSMEMVAAHGEPHVRGSLDRLRACCRLSALVAIAYLVFLYAEALRPY